MEMEYIPLVNIWNSKQAIKNAEVSRIHFTQQSKVMNITKPTSYHN